MPAAITSVGAVTGHGRGARLFVEALLEGRTAIRKATRFPTVGLCSDLAAEAPPDEALVTRWGLPEDRASRLLLAAAEEAWSQAGPASAHRGVIVGTTKGALETQLRRWKDGQSAVGDPLGAPAQALASAVNAQGPVQTVGAACASSSAALGEALAWIEEGICDEVWVGGCEGLHEFVYLGFHALKALSPHPAAPFDEARSGLSLGEGAGVLVLESAERVRSHHRPVLAWVEGFGSSADGHDQTAPDPQGKGLLAACRQALTRAGRRPSELGRYHAHGTATLHNDRMEAAVYRSLFEQSRPPLTGAKGCVGHTLGAAGALDVIACSVTLSQGRIAPVTHLRKIDPTLDIPAVSNAWVTDTSNCALVSTAGFGGINTALVLASTPRSSEGRR